MTQSPRLSRRLKSAKIKDTPSEVTVREVVEAFLCDAGERMTTGCLHNYRIFARHLVGSFGSIRADHLSDTGIETYARSRVDWSITYRHQFLGFVVTVYRFAIREKLIESNPLQNVRKPPKRSRGADAVLTESEHQQLIAECHDPHFIDLLRLLWFTGARPSEIAGLTAGQVKASQNRVIPLSDHKTAHRGKPRALLFCDEAWAIIERRATGVDDSKLLFTGQTGQRLTATAIGSRLTRLAKRAGVRHTIPYGYRHTLATDALSKGVSDATVAAMLGHSSTSMLHKHYSHLTSRFAALLGELKRVR